MPKDITIYEGREARTFQGVKKIKTSGDTYWVPEDDYIAQSDTIMTELYDKFWGTVDVSGTWTLNSVLGMLPYVNNTPGTYSFAVNFTSNGTLYTSLSLVIPSSGDNITVKYGTTTVYSNNTWTNNNYKTLTITNGTDKSSPDLAWWLYRNDTSYNNRSSQDKFDTFMNIIVRNFLDYADMSGNRNIYELSYNMLMYL